MNLREWGERLRGAVAQMDANRQREGLIIANDLNAMVWLRIQTTGKAYTGATFSPYSDAYKKVRRKAGAQTSYVDFTVTGQLARNVRPEVVASDNNSVTIEVTARDSANQMKLRGATVQPKGSPRGNILIPNEREIGIAQQANRDRVLKYINNA